MLSSKNKPRNRPPPPSPPPPKLSQPQSDGLMNNIIQGFGWGVGTSFGHRMSDNLFSNTAPQKTTPKNENPLPIHNNDDCLNELEKYQQCVCRLPYAEYLLNNTHVDCENMYQDYFKCTQKH
jgi:hypothetical protein